MQVSASLWVAAHAKGSPDITAPRVNTSGAVASATLVIAPPAESPVTNTRVESTPLFCSRYCTICTSEVIWGPERVCSLPVNQLKQLLFAVVCGYATMNPYWSASAFHPALT
jgi:hypothetical protein